MCERKESYEMAQLSAAYGKPREVNKSRLRQNGRHFQTTFSNSFSLMKILYFDEDFNEKLCILMKISLKFVPRGPINNIPALFQIMAWRRTGNNPFSEAMMS